MRGVLGAHSSFPIIIPARRPIRMIKPFRTYCRECSGLQPAPLGISMGLGGAELSWKGISGRAQWRSRKSNLQPLQCGTCTDLFLLYTASIRHYLKLQFALFGITIEVVVELISVKHYPDCCYFVAISKTNYDVTKARISQRSCVTTLYGGRCQAVIILLTSLATEMLNQICSNAQSHVLSI